MLSPSLKPFGRISLNTGRSPSFMGRFTGLSIPSSCLPSFNYQLHETSWDLGPCAAVHCNVRSWTHRSLSNKMQRNCMRRKTIAYTHSWSKFLTPKIQRDQKSQLPLLRSHEWRQGIAHCRLHTPPPQSWAKHLKLPSSPMPGHTPTLTQVQALREQASKGPCCRSSHSLQQRLQ